MRDAPNSLWPLPSVQHPLNPPLQQRYKRAYSTKKPLKMHIQTDAAVQSTKDKVIRKLDLSLTGDQDDDLVKIMPILTPVISSES